MTPTEEDTYTHTLFYLEPTLVGRNPVAFEWERKEYHFNAPDDEKAWRQACRFLGRNPIICDKVTQRREGKKLQRNHPLQVLREFTPALKLSLTGS